MEITWLVSKLQPNPRGSDQDSKAGWAAEVALGPRRRQRRVFNTDPGNGGGLPFGAAPAGFYASISNLNKEKISTFISILRTPPVSRES